MSENKKSPLKFFPAVATALGVSTGVLGAGIIGGGILAGRSIRRGINRRRRDRLAAEAEFDRRLKIYEDSTFQELDPDDYKQENVFEDVQVDNQAVEFASEQFKQQQANIMQAFKGVAGGSGVGALAQGLSNQAAKQAKESQIYITKQLAENKKLRLAEQSRLNQQQTQLTLSNVLGRRQFEADKMATMIGVAGQKVAGANQRIANVQAMTGQIIGGLSEIAASAVTPVPGS